MSTGAWVNLGRWDEGRSTSMSLSPYVGIRFSTSLTANLGASLYRADDDSQWLDNFTDGSGSTHHAFAHLDQRTVSFNTRVSYTATPELTLELYAEPFTSSGIYSDVRELSGDPGAGAYVDRFQAYAPPAGTAMSFSFRQIRTNTVLRWEYSPGSTLFLVWAHGREGRVEDVGRQPWMDDFGSIMDLEADNTFLLKVSYWLNR